MSDEEKRASGVGSEGVLIGSDVVYITRHKRIGVNEAFKYPNTETPHTTYMPATVVAIGP
jgi:hypothetical protein